MLLSSMSDLKFLESRCANEELALAFSELSLSRLLKYGLGIKNSLEGLRHEGLEDWKP